MTKPLFYSSLKIRENKVHALCVTLLGKLFGYFF